MMINGETVSGLRRRLQDQNRQNRRMVRWIGSLLAGFVLAAAKLGGDFQPLVLGLVCTVAPGVETALLALGGSIGYLVFFGLSGWQGAAWMAGGMAAAALCGGRVLCKRQALLLPAAAALVVSLTGVVFQHRFLDRTPVGMYLLRVAVAAASAAVFAQWLRQKSGWAKWVVQAMGVLALAGISPMRYLGLGYLAAGIMGSAGSFPSAVLAGLALDLAAVTRVRMTGAMCLGYCLRQIPGLPGWLGSLAVGAGYLLMAGLGGSWDICPLPGLLLGSALAGMYPELEKPLAVQLHRGEAAVAQVRLERMALALQQMESSLSQVQESPPEEDTLLRRVRSEACDTCPERKGCRARLSGTPLQPRLLHQPGLGEGDLPAGCRKPARLLASLRRGQEQLRRIHADRSHVAACRQAAREQYGFLAEFLRLLSDDLARRRQVVADRFEPEVTLSSHSAREENGDQCAWFPGTGNRYYVLLCDGMGTGAEAARESREAIRLLRQMLQAGTPAESALKSLNSLAILRELGGCTTVDLLQLQLDTGRGQLLKWGAPSSCLIQSGQLRLLGEQTPPPGLSQQLGASCCRLSLARGETLILHSDGVRDDSLLRLSPGLSPAELAAQLLRPGETGADDATVAVVRLIPR